MALRKIIVEGHPTLRKKSRPVEKFDDRLATLIDDMKETLVDANGVGLAAPQVAILRRICIVDNGEELLELVITGRAENTREALLPLLREKP
jgi:peptide deformylase